MAILIQCLHGVAVTQTSGILIAFGGALIIATGEASVKVSDHTGSIIGLTFALAAVGARSVKIVIMDVLLAPKALFVGQGVLGKPTRRTDAQVHLNLFSTWTQE